MFQFPACPLPGLYIQPRVPGHYSRQVAPFGNPRIKRSLAAPRGLSQQRYVLLRPLVPRHPPCALISLTFLYTLFSAHRRPSRDERKGATSALRAGIARVCVHLTYLKRIRLATTAEVRPQRRSFADLYSRMKERGRRRLGGSGKSRVEGDRSSSVEMGRLELPTPCVQSRCSPS